MILFIVKGKPSGGVSMKRAFEYLTDSEGGALLVAVSTFPF